MSSVNKAIILGNVGKDPEVRSLTNGDPVCNLSVATSETWKDKQTGEKKERTEWHRINLFGPLAKIAGDYVRKGSKVYIEGQIQTRKWQDQSGQDKYSTEIVVNGFGGKLVLLGEKKGGEHADYDGGSSGDLDDEIPF